MTRTRLFNKDFLLLWIGQSVSKLGNGAGFIAVMWWVQSTTGSGVALGTLALITGLVYTVLGPFGGVIADRFNRKVIIVVADTIRGCIYTVLAILAFNNSLSLPLLFLGSALSAACSAFFTPAVSASIPQLVPDKHLERANGLNQVSTNIVNIMGYAAGGIMVAFLGVPTLMLANGISFLLSAFSELFISIPKITRTDTEFNIHILGTDLKEGLQYIKETSILFKIMRIGMVLNFFYAPFFVLLPKFVGDYLGAGSAIYGYLLSASMVGGLIATLIVSLTTIVKRNLWLVKWGIVIQCAALSTLVFLPKQLWLLHAGVMFISGLFNTLVNVYFHTILQRIVAPQYLGKVLALMSTVMGALQPISQGATGILADYIGIPIVYIVSCIASCASGVSFTTLPNISEFLSGKRLASEEHRVASI